MPLPPPSLSNNFHEPLARLICESYERVVGRSLLPAGPAIAQAIFEAPFAVVAHDTQAVPVFMYGNGTALRRFAMTWAEFTLLPSAHSAEAVNREERARLLAQVSERGFIRDYSGVRIAKDGSRFRIENATVWNLSDAAGVYRGQAACFREWVDL